MEKLKSIIPDRIKRMIEESGPDDLPSTCSALLHWCLQTPLFHKIVGELAGADTALCSKNMEAALDFKRKGNSFFTKGDYASALHFYSKALRLVPIDAQDMEKNLVATLYVNRASSLYKMDRLVECLRDCNRAIVISPSYAKAWYRRGVANSALGNNHHATCDLKISGILEPSPSGKGRVERELKETRDKCRSKSSSVVHQDGTSQSCIDENVKMKLNIVHTPTKGRGLTIEVDIPEADVVPCPSCSIPVYCSQDCQLRAGGMFERNIPKSNSIHKNITDELQKHIAEITVTDRCKLDGNHFAEHSHECKGVNWPAVLPPDIVLAGRILCKGKHLADNFEHLTALDLAHNYAQKTPEDKLEFHIYAIVLLSCLQQSHDPEIQPDGVLIAQLVILISQIKVNSMAVVHMKSTDINVALGESRAGGPSTSTLEQVGQWDLKDRQQRLHNDYSFECQCEGCVDLNLSDLVLNAFGCADRSCAGVVLEIGAAEYEKKRLKALQSSPNTSRSKHLQQHQTVCMNTKTSRKEDFNNMACHMLSHESNQIKPGYCLNCGSHLDLEVARIKMYEAEIPISRLQDAIGSEKLQNNVLSDAVRSFKLLKSVLHKYNKRIAEVLDILSQAFCLIGDLEAAIGYCKSSIEILEKIYAPDHIVIAYELWKLASIQLAHGDSTCADCLKGVRLILTRYFGSQMDMILPQLESYTQQPC